MAYVLGPIFEQSLRTSLRISGGSFLIFVERPICAVALGFAALLLLSNLVPFIKARRKKYEGFAE